MAIWTRLRNLLRKPQLDNDLDAEFQVHFEQLAADLQAAGLSPADARSEARRRFGNVTALREQYREQRDLPWLETLAADVRFGVRMLARKPGFTAAALAALALGIGANSLVFSLLYGVLLKPLPYVEPERIVALHQTNLKKGAAQEEVAAANFLDWRARNQVFEAIGMAEPFSHELTGDGEPESYSSWIVSEDFFRALGARPVLGRTFEPGDYQLVGSDASGYTAGSADVVVIGHALWRQRFGGDPGIIGRRLTLRGRPFTVIGVLPPEFDYPGKRQIYAPRITAPRDRMDRFANYRKVVARLKPGIGVGAAQQDMDRVARELAREFPNPNRDIGVAVEPLQDQLFGKLRPALLLLAGAVAFVLLVACANVANLILARGSERERELAVRAALGASHARIRRQLLTEVLVLAAFGGLLGLALGAGGLALARDASASGIPRLAGVSVNGWVLGFSALVTLLAAVLAGLYPAWRLARNPKSPGAARGAAASPARHRARAALAIAQITLALVLLSGAALLARSFLRLTTLDPGFRAARILSLEVHIWTRARQPEQRRAFFAQTLAEINALPGVQAAAAVSALPLHPNAIDIFAGFQIPGRPTAPNEEVAAEHTVVTTRYFETLGIPLKRGRLFTAADAAGAPCAVVVNETFARRYFPGEDPLGRPLKLFLLRGQTGAPPACEVVGIAGDTRSAALDQAIRPSLYMHHDQNPTGSMTYVVRTASDPAALTAAIKQRIWGVNRNQPFVTISTVEQLIADSLGERRFLLALIGAFASIALGLAAIGIYGLLSFTTTQRTGEIGIRMALGASGGQILTLVVREALQLALAGVALGALGALALSRWLAALLYDTSPRDPAVLAAAALAMLAIAGLAAWIPAARAARVDPMTALRTE